MSTKNIEFSLLDIYIGKLRIYGLSIASFETDNDLRSLLGVDYHSDTKEFVVCVLFRYWTFDLSK